MKQKLARLENLVEELKHQHDELGIYNFLCFIDTSTIVMRYLEYVFGPATGLDNTKIQILDLLLVNGGTSTPSKLSSSTFRNRMSITNALDKLDKMGLTRSSRPRNNRRLRKVTITEKGLDLMEKYLQMRKVVFTEAMDCFNREDNKKYCSLMERFRENMFSLLEKYGFVGENVPQRDSSFFSQLAKKKRRSATRESNLERKS